MANEEKIDEIIGAEALAQVQKLTDALTASDKVLIDNIKSATTLNSVIAKSKTFAEFNKSSAAASAQTERLLKLQAQRQIQEEKLAAVQASNRAAEEKREKAREVAAEREIKKQAEIEAAIAKKTKTVISDSQAEIDAANKAAAGSASVTSAVTAEQEAYGRLTSQISTNTKSVTANQVANNKNNLTKKQLAFLLAEEKFNQQRATAELKNQVRESNSVKGSLEQRRAALIRLNKVYDNQSPQERATAAGQRLQGVIGRLTEQVLTLEKGTGRSQRNVGNYLSTAYSGVKTLANILPGVGIAGVIGFALDPLLDYIGTLDILKTKVSEAVKTRKLLADVSVKGGQDSAKELTDLKLLYNAYQNANLPLKARKEAYSELQNLYPDYFGNLKFESEASDKTKNSYNTLTTAILATGRARAAADKIAENASRKFQNEQTVIDERIKLEEAITRRTQAQARSRVISQSEGAGTRELSGAQAQAASRIARETERIEASSKIIREAKKDNLILDERDARLVGYVTTQLEKGAKLTGGVGGKAEKAKKEKPDTSALDAQKAIVEGARSAQKAILDDEKATIDERLGALQNYVSLSNQLSEIEAMTKRKLGKDTKVVLEQQVKENQDTQIESIKYLTKITDEANKKAIADATKAEQDEILVIQSGNAAKLQQIEQFRAEAAQGVAEQYAEGLISRKQYEQQLSEIESQAILDSIQVQIDALKEQIALEKNYLGAGIGTNKALADDEAKLAKLEIDLSKKKTDAKIRDKQREADAAKQLHDAEIQLAMEVLNFGIQLGRASYERRLNQIQDEIDAGETKKAFDIEQVNDSVASEEDKANQIAIINARAAAQQAVLEQKQRQEKQRQARFDKAASIAQIIANTAVAVMKTYAEFGFPVGVPLAITQAAIGAVQVATVLATPIPKYKYGKKDNYSGPAVVGDGYEHELRIDPGGKVSLTPDTPTLTNVSAGTRIIGGADLKKMISLPRLNVMNKESSGNGDVVNAMNKVHKAIKGQGRHRTILTEKGLQTSSKTASGITKYLNSNFN